MSDNVTITDLTSGPYVIVVNDPTAVDLMYPLVISPPEGYPTKEAALHYIEKFFAGRKEPYLGLKFHVTRLDSEFDFVKFCSWED